MALCREALANFIAHVPPPHTHTSMLFFRTFMFPCNRLEFKLLIHSELLHTCVIVAAVRLSTMRILMSTPPLPTHRNLRRGGWLVKL